MIRMAAPLCWLLTPFVAGALVGHSKRALDLISRRFGLCLGIGWTGMALLVWGATALGQPAGMAAFLVGGPAAGLAFWGRHDGGTPPAPQEDAPEPPAWDWERFERDLRDHTADRDHPGVLAGRR